eukprot:TRINITY_DN54308_c0_g1_i1.p1 TRINITY_DN54308_c0_g1~~TRINITY_DN54308_c0_g1_i1.p1  ORF type:complete len:440 (-),score=130.17 TRINITY_DN54308_c0_g1_i1:78-1397(-)
MRCLLLTPCLLVLLCVSRSWCYVSQVSSAQNAAPPRALRSDRTGRSLLKHWDAKPGHHSEEASSPLTLRFVLSLLAAIVVAMTPKQVMASGWSHDDIPAWSKEFPMCSAKSQSPINIVTPDVKDAGKPVSLSDLLKYKPLDGRAIINNGHVIQVDGGFGTFTLPDGTYEVKQFHLHFPAEHEVDGKLGAGELHIVHQRQGASGTDGLAVLGIVLEESEQSTPETEFLSGLGFGKSLPKKGENNSLPAKVDLNVFKDQINSGFYHYNGSLTTPPCAENVHWYVASKSAAVSKDMIKTFQERFPAPVGDNRPVQPVNGRQVLRNGVAVDGEFEQGGAGEFANIKSTLKAQLQKEIAAINDEAEAKKKLIDVEAQQKKERLAAKFAEKLKAAEGASSKLVQARKEAAARAAEAKKRAEEAAAAEAAAAALEAELKSLESLAV